MTNKEIYCSSVLVAFILFAGLFSCKKARYEKYGDYGTLESGGKKRRYIVHTPANYHEDSSYALLIALHGRFGDAAEMAEGTGFNDVSDYNNFIICYPEGHKKSWADATGLSPASEDEIDDVKFLSNLIEKLEEDYAVDAARIYLAGMSNGGLMVQTAACRLSGKIAAFASVIASMPEDLAGNCMPANNVAALYILSTHDNLVPYNGGDISANDGGTVLSADSSLAFWRMHNECSSTPDSIELPDNYLDGTTQTKFRWTGCNSGTEVELVRVNNGGHNWPGGRQVWTLVTGNQCKDFDASIYIWNFVSRFSKP